MLYRAIIKIKNKQLAIKDEHQSSLIIDIGLQYKKERC
jgi:hypothetical protein